MLSEIEEAIRNRKVLSFIYSGIPRTVHPAAVGKSKAGNDVLRCYQVEGGHVTQGHTWDLCLLSKMRDLRETGGSFNQNPPGYVRGDSHMTRIFAQL